MTRSFGLATAYLAARACGLGCAAPGPHSAPAVGLAAGHVAAEADADADDSPGRQGRVDIRCGGEEPDAPLDVGVKRAEELCCSGDAPVLSIGDAGSCRPFVGDLALGCVAGARLSMHVPCQCMDVCADAECSTSWIPAFLVEIENCSEEPFWVSATPNRQLFIRTTRAESGEVFMGGRRFDSPGPGAPSPLLLERWCVLLPGERSAIRVPLWMASRGGDDSYGPPPTGWYVVTAGLYPPSGYLWRGVSDVVKICDDWEMSEGWRQMLGEDVVDADDGACRTGAGSLVGRDAIGTLTGVDSWWPDCNGGLSGSVCEAGPAAEPQLLFVDAGPVRVPGALGRRFEVPDAGGCGDPGGVGFCPVLPPLVFTEGVCDDSVDRYPSDEPRR